MESQTTAASSTGQHRPAQGVSDGVSGNVIHTLNTLCQVTHRRSIPLTVILKLQQQQ